MNLKNDGQWELPQHLFVKDAGQTKCDTIAVTQNKQANEHDQKQNQVGNHRRNKTKYAGFGVDRVTSVLLYRVRNEAKLRMRWAKWVQGN